MRRAPQAKRHRILRRYLPAGPQPPDRAIKITGRDPDRRPDAVAHFTLREILKHARQEFPARWPWAASGKRRSDSHRHGSHLALAMRMRDPRRFPGFPGRLSGLAAEIPADR